MPMKKIIYVLFFMALIACSGQEEVPLGFYFIEDSDQAARQDPYFEPNLREYCKTKVQIPTESELKKYPDVKHYSTSTDVLTDASQEHLEQTLGFKLKKENQFRNRYTIEILCTGSSAGLEGGVYFSLPKDNAQP